MVDLVPWMQASGSALASPVEMFSNDVAGKYFCSKDYREPLPVTALG